MWRRGLDKVRDFATLGLEFLSEVTIMMRSLFVGGLLLLVSPNQFFAQSSPLQFKQTRDSSQPQLLTSAEFALLGDPLFNLLLKEKANTVKLSEVQAVIQPKAANRHVFVISERIVRTAPMGSRRAVLAFDGANAGEKDLKGNVMLSVSFGPNGFLENNEIEAWGWDNHRNRYNYYKLDSGDSPKAKMTWKFRGSSENADLRSPLDRVGTCIRCHVVGAPVMKELFFPWNNWHAGVGASFVADYLVRNSANPNKWPAAITPPFERLSTADKLESDFLIKAFKRFNQSRLNSALKRDDATNARSITDMKMTVLEGRRLLRPLFETVEINLISSRNTSGIHPFNKPNDFVSNLEIKIPGAFFLNTHLIAGGGNAGLGGLKLTEANQFPSFAKLSQQENKDLIEKFKLVLNGVRGDAHFGWFVPEPGFLDNDLVDRAMQLGVITPHFVAAVLAVDVESPVFSAKRAELLKFVPDQFEFTPVPTDVDPVNLPRDAAKDLLTQAVLESINKAKPAPGTSADEFRNLLTTANAVGELQSRVKAYVKRVKTRLDPANPVQRNAELERLYEILIDRRRLMRAHPVLQNLDETNGQLLFPLPIGN